MWMCMCMFMCLCDEQQSSLHGVTTPVCLIVRLAILPVFSECLCIMFIQRVYSQSNAPAQSKRSYPIGPDPVRADPNRHELIRVRPNLDRPLTACCAPQSAPLVGVRLSPRKTGYCERRHIEEGGIESRQAIEVILCLAQKALACRQPLSLVIKFAGGSRQFGSALTYVTICFLQINPAMPCFAAA